MSRRWAVFLPTPAKRELAWMALAMRRRPVPDSPSRMTGASEGATRSSRAKSVRMPSDCPSTGPKLLRSLGVTGTGMSPERSCSVLRPRLTSVPMGKTLCCTLVEPT